MQNEPRESIKTKPHKPHPLTFGHLGLRRRALTASSRAVWYWPSLRWAAERLLYRMQFCGSARRASPYSFTAVWKSPIWQASLLCRTFSMNSALLRLGPSAAACTALPRARGPNRPNCPERQKTHQRDALVDLDYYTFKTRAGFIGQKKVAFRQKGFSLFSWRRSQHKSASSQTVTTIMTPQRSQPLTHYHMTIHIYPPSINNFSVFIIMFSWVCFTCKF